MIELDHMISIIPNKLREGGVVGRFRQWRVKLFGSFDNLLCQTEVETYAKENKRSLLFYSTGENGL